MIVTIYGLREKGCDEIRYIGMTKYALHHRIRKHRQNAAHNYPPKISEWINSAPEIDIVPLSICCGRAARCEERRQIESHFQAGHRLTNSHLMPRARQTGAAA